VADPLKLNWGSGPEVHPGWVNTDRDRYPGLDFQGDLLDGLPWPDNHFDLVFSSHALQMVGYTDLPLALGELRRVLKPGCVMRTVLPDPIAAFRAWETMDHPHFMIDDTLEPSIDGKLCLYLTWFSTARSLFTARYLCKWLTDYGWDRAEEVYWGTSLSEVSGACDLDNRPDESFIVEAFK